MELSTGDKLLFHSSNRTAASFRHRRIASITWLTCRGKLLSNPVDLATYVRLSTRGLLDRIYSILLRVADAILDPLLLEGF
jgi:hypothetical protein